MDLATTSSMLRLLSDPTRVRLLSPLAAGGTDGRRAVNGAATGATQGLDPPGQTQGSRSRARPSRGEVSPLYRINNDRGSELDGLLAVITESLDDATLDQDRERLPVVLGKRADEQGWADSVAGDMERHDSPGRTWETLARALLQLLETGDVLDIASGDGGVGELLAPHARSVVCVDSSPRVVEAARKRLEQFKNVRVTERATCMHSNLGASDSIWY